MIINNITQKGENMDLAIKGINVARDKPLYRSWWTWFFNWSHQNGIFKNQSNYSKSLERS